MWAAAMHHLADAGDRLAALDGRARRTGGERRRARRAARRDDGHATSTRSAPIPTSRRSCRAVATTSTWGRRTPTPCTAARRSTPSGTYRITGELGTARQVTIMPFTARMGSSEPFDLAELTPGPDGRFDVLVSPERPVGHTGDWWQLGPDIASLWLRVVSDDWGNEREPRVAIRRVDGSDVVDRGRRPNRSRRSSRSSARSSSTPSATASATPTS